MPKPSKGTSEANALALGGLLFLLLRLLAVAHYDWDVAFSLADSVNFNDVIGVVVGTFLGAGSLTAIILALILPVAFLHHYKRLRDRDWRPHHLVMLAVLVGVFVAAVITLRDWATLLVVLVISTAFMIVVLRDGPGRPWLEKASSHLGVTVWLGLFALAGLTDTVWVPEAILTLRDGGTVSGYIIDVHSPYTEVLTAHGRQIRVVMSQDVVSRAEK
ncbi:hypothetical protein [Actinomadura harenae]|uniref:Uncharacterized protein n=1 Tax=Actinomadura harenae TaxID=2483351 RepID=A0A3M2M0K2_9ACTN|nr:hypothetical protein [Actinomadura harenae]RMI41905.1 hypothetical protein EBO15_21570 [Actinomadura harenae]